MPDEGPNSAATGLSALPCVSSYRQKFLIRSRVMGADVGRGY